jgi:hypothetical protein
LLIVALLQYIVLGVGLFIYPQYCKTDLHTSALSGRAWLDELLGGHPDRIYIALGMRRHVFDKRYPSFISSKAILRAASTFFVGDIAEDVFGAKTLSITCPIPSTERPRARIDSGPVVRLRLLLQGTSTSSEGERFNAVAGVVGTRKATVP